MQLAPGVEHWGLHREIRAEFFGRLKDVSIEGAGARIRATRSYPLTRFDVQTDQAGCAKKTFTYQGGRLDLVPHSEISPEDGKVSKLDLSAIQAGARLDKRRYEKRSGGICALERPKRENLWETAIGPPAPLAGNRVLGDGQTSLGETLVIHTGWKSTWLSHHENENRAERAVSRQALL